MELYINNLVLVLVKHLCAGEVVAVLTVCIVYTFLMNVSQMDYPLRCYAILAVS